ncbi:MAG TPA: CRTAC1 family protein [Planctomycetota bacterium]|nr:CRTAC1 family protein [Planctomycetota bacterium]
MSRGTLGLALLLASSCGRSDADPAEGSARTPPRPSPPAAAPAAPATIRKEVRFVDATEESGVSLRTVCGDPKKTFIVESLGTGVALFDADGDGDQDLFHGNGAPLTPPADSSPAPGPVLYLNDGRGRFRDVTKDSGLGRPGAWHGTAAADWNGDGRPDLLLTGWRVQALYANRGVGGKTQGVPWFTDVTGAARLRNEGWSTSAAFADLDRDGDLDLYVCHYITFDPKTAPRDCPWKGIKAYCGPEGLTPESDAVYRNEGDGTFSEVTREWGYDPGEAFYGLGVVIADLDGDGDPDTYVGNDSTRNLLFRNLGDGRAEEVGVLSGVAFGDEGQEQASMGVDVGDYDGDGRPDLFVTNFEGDYSTLYRNSEGEDGGLLFEDVTIPAGLERITWVDLGWSTRFFDYDHDGDEDLFSANGHVYPQANLVPDLSYEQENELFRNDGGKFVLANATAGPGWKAKKSFRGGAAGDLDEDGDLDLVFTALDDVSTVLRNEGADATPWIRFLAVGRRSERDGVGAFLLLEAGGRRQTKEVRANTGYLSTFDARAHFGLGAAERVDRLLVRWPSGREDSFGPLPGRRTYRLVEGSPPEPLARAGG